MPQKFQFCEMSKILPLYKRKKDVSVVAATEVLNCHNIRIKLWKNKIYPWKRQNRCNIFSKTNGGKEEGRSEATFCI